VTGCPWLLQSASAQSGHEGWQSLRAPGFWEKEFGGAVEAHDGFAWYRCFVKVPPSWKDGAVTLELGPIDDCDETFFNGVKVGGLGTVDPFKTASGEPRRYQVDPKQVRAGAYNLIAVRVFDNGQGLRTRIIVDNLLQFDCEATGLAWKRDDSIRT
jgi:hypothetical protein